MESPDMPKVPGTQEPNGGFPVQPTEVEGVLPPPRPKKTTLSTVLHTAGILAAAAGGLFILSQAIPGRTMGATRSYRLKCEERQQQIEAAAKEDVLAGHGSPEHDPGAE